MSFVKLNRLLQKISILKIVNCQTIHCYKDSINNKCWQINCKGHIFKVVNLQNYLKFHKRKFHTTTPNRALPPVFWIFMRSILKIAAVMTGRGVRLWWAKLLPSEKQRIINKIRENRPKIWLGSFIFGTIVSFYYVSHLVEDPVTRRKKFLLFSEKQIIQIANMECDFIMKKLKNSIRQSGNYYDIVLKTSQQLLQSNKHFPGVKKKWEVYIIDDVSKKNAFVLPSGHIFIFTGMFKVISNDDQLAVILAHEIAHALLNHSAEILSKSHFIELLMLLPIILIWTLLPDFIALSSHFLIEMICTILFRLPMNRQMEIEADVIGLVMAARACYDPREATKFWKTMENVGEAEVMEWLSTHPRYKTRCEILQRRMPEALLIHDRYCSNSSMDPQN